MTWRPGRVLENALRKQDSEQSSALVAAVASGEQTAGMC